jgi:hypothetical protein
MMLGETEVQEEAPLPSLGDPRCIYCGWAFRPNNVQEACDPEYGASTGRMCRECFTHAPRKALADAPLVISNGAETA